MSTNLSVRSIEIRYRIIFLILSFRLFSLFLSLFGFHKVNKKWFIFDDEWSISNDDGLLRENRLLEVTSSSNCTKKFFRVKCYDRIVRNVIHDTRINIPRKIDRDGSWKRNRYLSAGRNIMYSRLTYEFLGLYDIYLESNIRIESNIRNMYAFLLIYRFDNFSFV